MPNFEQPTFINNHLVTGRVPNYDEIPEDFKDMNAHHKKTEAAKWIQWQEEWFFNGIKSFPKVKDGIDEKAARSHLASIQRSFDIKHEHKMAAVAYLASLWLEPYWETVDA